jgi:hypothetical protein
MTADTESSGPFTIWLNYRQEGWQPSDPLATLAECLDYRSDMGHTGDFRITRDVDWRIVEVGK